MKKNRKFFIGILVLACVLLLQTACGKDSIDYMVLVNKESKLPEDWEEKVELVDVYTGLDETYQVEKKTAEAYKKLKEDLANDHVIIELDSTYRTVKRQQEIWDQFEKDKGLDYAKKYVAVPGTSEHHTGLAIDVKLVKNGKIIEDNDEMTAEKELFAKVHAKLAKYGFILRYPEGKESITGYNQEVWHFRYIDDVDAAKEIMDKGLTFEEYLKSKEK